MVGLLVGLLFLVVIQQNVTVNYEHLTLLLQKAYYQHYQTPVVRMTTKSGDNITPLTTKVLSMAFTSGELSLR